MRGPTDQLAIVLPALADLVDRVEPEDLANPSPCEAFALHDVLDHVIVLGGTFAHLFRGEVPPAIEPPVRDGSVPAAEVRKVCDDLLDAVRSPGAMERTIVAPVGEMPGDTFARLVAFDGVVHGWDVARAAGLPWVLPDDVVAEVDAFARQAITDDLRDGDTFAAPTTPPSGATAIESLAAFSGRTV